MRYLALDLWNKRVGVSISRESIAFPEAVIERVKIINWLKKYFLEYPDISMIIVGMPYDLYGVDTRQSDKTQKFIKKLEEIFPDKKIISHDERFSTFDAGQGFWDHRDDIAAQCILQSYIDSKQ